MNIPESVNILYKKYDIEMVDNLHDEKGDLYGQIRYLPEKIYLNSAAKEQQMKATLIHEVIHAMDEMYNIGLKENAPGNIDPWDGLNEIKSYFSPTRDNSASFMIFLK